MAICNGFLEEPEANQVRHSRISALFARDESYLGWARWMVSELPSPLKKESEKSDHADLGLTGQLLCASCIQA